MGSENREFISFQGAVQVLLTLLGFIVVGMGGVVIQTYNSLELRVRTNESAVAHIQDTMAQDAINSKANAALITDLQTSQQAIQRQLDTDQTAIHDLSDAIGRLALNAASRDDADGRRGRKVRSNP